MKKAEETANWPAYPAKITSADIVKIAGDDGEPDHTYLSINGKYVDTGEPFTVKRYAYGAVNGLSPRQPYIAPYKPGYLTTVYVDPKDRNNVILCNNPSLTGSYMIMGGSALAIAGILWWLLSGSRKWAAYRAMKKAAEPLSSVRSSQTKEVPRWVGLLIGFGMMILFLGLGIWIIYTGIVGESPAEHLSTSQSKIVICMGLLFAFGGFFGLVQAIFNGNPPPLLNKIMISLFMLFLGLPFIAVPLFDPGGITSTGSFGGLVVHESKGSSMGAVVFMLAGIGCLFIAFWPWRWWKR